MKPSWYSLLITGLHTVVTQAACMDGCGLEPAAQGIHLGQRGDLACVAVVVGVAATGQGGAGRRFGGDEAGVAPALEPVCHVLAQDAPQVGAAAGAADDDVGVFADPIHGDAAFAADDGLMQQHLI